MTAPVRSSLDSTATSELPRPPWMSKRHREYLHRLMVRRGVLIIRLGTTSQKDKQEIQKEADALEWAIGRLSEPPK